MSRPLYKVPGVESLPIETLDRIYHQNALIYDTRCQMYGFDSPLAQEMVQHVAGWGKHYAEACIRHGRPVPFSLCNPIAH